MPPPPFLHMGLRSNHNSRSNLDTAASNHHSRTNSGNPGRHGSHATTPRGGGGGGSTPGTGGRTTYPEALPSALSQRYDGPVSGVAIIDHDYTAIDALVEMVTPTATPLMEPLTLEYLHDCVEEMDIKCQHELARGDPADMEDDGHDGELDSLADSEEYAERKREEARNADPAEYEAAREQRRRERESLRPSFFSSAGRASVPTSTTDLTDHNGSFTKRHIGGLFRRTGKAARHAMGGDGHEGHHRSPYPSSGSFAGLAEDAKARRERKPRKLLKEGGFVVFADEYLQNHPCSPVASITQEYQLVNPPEEPIPPPNPKLDEKKRKVEDIKRLIKEAERQHRPLFRRRPAELVYGEARYVPRPHDNIADGNAESDSQQQDAEADVYLAASFDSSTSAISQQERSATISPSPKPATGHTTTDTIQQNEQRPTVSATLEPLTSSSLRQDARVRSTGHSVNASDRIRLPSE